MRNLGQAAAILAGLAFLWPSGPAGAEAVHRWDIAGASIALEPAANAGFIDETGRYGVAGRRLAFDAVRGVLDPSGMGNTLTRENRADPWADYD